MLEKIKTAIEDITQEPLKGRNVYLKLFCGLAYKHSFSTQKEVAAFLDIPITSAAYYKKEHISMCENTEYRQLCREVEDKIL